MTSRPRRLLNLDANAKTVKGQKRGYKTAILYLAPVNLSGYQVCPMASEGCKAACLNTAGRAVVPGRMGNNIQAARIAKTRWFFEDRTSFLAQLVKELAAFVRKTRADGFEPVVRLNGTSDILWERVPVELYDVEQYIRNDDLIRELHEVHGYVAPNIMALFPDVQFYDYTKHRPEKRANLPTNYSLTFSLAEDNEGRAAAALMAGWNVAVVFRRELPEFYTIGNVRAPVVNGDEHDLRFLDNHPSRCVIVGLKAKGRAKHDRSGFVRD